MTEETRLARIEAKLDELNTLIRSVSLQIARQGAWTMTIIDDAFAALNAKVTELTNAEQAADALLAGNTQLLKDALALGDPKAVVAQVADITAKLEANRAAQAAAIVANTLPPSTPPAPAPAPAPAPTT